MIINSDYIYRFFAGELNGSQVDEIMQWAKSSPENEAFLRRERKLFDAITLYADTSVPAESGHRTTSFWRRYAVRIACCLVFLIGASLALFRGAFNQEDASMNVITVPAGERVCLTLSDGSLVWLNSGTTFSYPSGFDRKAREVAIDGQAYFEVAHDSKKPFTVHTYLNDIHVLGTKFDVWAMEKNRSYKTSLLEGVVSVTAKDDQRSSLTLIPNQELVIEGGKYRIRDIVDYESMKWKDGIYSFKEKKFLDIIEDFRRYYGKEIICHPDPSWNEEYLTGKFDVSDGISYALDILQNTVEFKYSINKDSNQIIIEHK